MALRKCKSCGCEYHGNQCPRCDSIESVEIVQPTGQPTQFNLGCFCWCAVLLSGFCALVYSCSAPSIKQSSEPQKVVQNSEWDASVSQVERWLKRTLKDPDSFQAIEWSKVAEDSNGFQVRCKYRAKNSFGGYVIENKVFFLNGRGEVTGSTDYK